MHHANVIKIYAGVSFIVRFVMAALCNRAGHYIFALWFLMVALCNRADHNIFMLFLSSFFFFSSPNLSGPRLDIYHSLAHGVALVRI